MENGWEKEKETRQEAVSVILARDCGARTETGESEDGQMSMELRDPSC